ncbi:hypothetical protein ACNQGB_07840, partial [Flavobacterium sp. XS1P32]|uniref:hypothetical protein n=1 Tax=Flavobacterium sp. XS1P32 TaxID=3401726 RepID=UPI003AB0187A
MYLGMQSLFFHAFHHPLLCSVVVSEKNFTYKIHVYSDLKHKLRKRQKKVNKKLVEVNKGGTF